jgi:hypothetical protein
VALLAGEQAVDGGELAGEADRGAHAFGVVPDVAAGDRDAAGIRPHERGQNVHRGGLAGAVGAEQRRDGAGAHG